MATVFFVLVWISSSPAARRLSRPQAPCGGSLRAAQGSEMDVAFRSFFKNVSRPPPRPLTRYSLPRACQLLPVVPSPCHPFREKWLWWQLASLFSAAAPPSEDTGEQQSHVSTCPVSAQVRRDVCFPCARAKVRQAELTERTKV